MKFQQGFSSFLFFAFILMHNNAFAQNTFLWKKRVARTVELDEHLSLNPGDSNLYMCLLADVFSRKVKAYRTSEPFFQEEVDISIDEKSSHREDSVTIVDLATGEEKTIVRPKPSFDSIRGYRILEEWEYDPVSGKASVHIIAIGPAKRVYGDDGTYRGTTTVFWLKYEDALKEFRSYEKKKRIPVIKRIWNDYFPDDPWNRCVASTIDLATVKNFFKAIITNTLRG